jgi:type 1 glutamine amidotransferase
MGGASDASGTGGANDGGANDGGASDGGPGGSNSDGVSDGGSGGVRDQGPGGTGGRGGTNEISGGSAGESSSSDETDDVREGPFEMLVYSNAAAFRPSSTPVGMAMVQEIADEYGFGVTFTQTNEEFTPEGLTRYEVVFFLNTSGDVLRSAEEDAFEDWMLDGGGFVGSYRAADTEYDWDFYKELTGQFYDGHSACCPQNDVQWAEDALDFPAVEGLPSPWARAELWFHFDGYPEWSTRAGFRILGTVELEGETHPVSFAREWSNFRSFYAGIGHQDESFADPLVKQHFTGGTLWVARREHWLPQ